VKQFSSLQELADYFRQQLPSGQIQIDETILSAPVLATMQSHLGTEAFALAVTAIPDPVGDTLSFPATVPQSDPLLNVPGAKVNPISFQLVGTEQVLQYSMQIEELGQGWTFGDSFSDLDVGGIDDLVYALQAPSLLFNTQGNDNTPGQEALRVASPLSLEGESNPLTAVLQFVPNLLEGFQATGTIIPTSNGLTLDLKASLSTEGFTLGGLLTLNPPYVGMQVSYIPTATDTSSDDTSLTTSTSATTTVSPYLAFYVGADITIKNDEGTELTLQFQATLYPDGNPFTVLTVRPDPAHPYEGSIGNLAQLVGQWATSNWDSLFSTPEAQDFLQSYLNTVGFKQLRAVYSFDAAAFTSMTLELGSITDPNTGKPMQWSLFGGELLLDIDLLWTLLGPSSGGGDGMSATLTTNVDVGGITFQIQVSIPSMDISAVYTGPTLELNLSEAVARLTGDVIELPQDLLELSLTSFAFAVSPKSNTWTLSLGGGADFHLFNLPLLTINDGLVTVLQTYPKQGGGDPLRVFTLDGIIGLVGIEYAVNGTIGSGPNAPDTVFSIHMVNETVGSVLNQLISLVDPGFQLSFAEPWNRLLDISLDALTFRINVTTGQVYITYNTTVDLGFIQITGIGLMYQKARTDTKGNRIPASTQISLDCTFLGKSYSGPDALSWDPMNEPAPPIQSGSTPVLDLNYLGLGQHVTPTDMSGDSIVDILEAMQKAMVPVDDGTTNPASLPGIRFSAESQWLIAARFTVMGAVELLPVFNDPALYGLRVSLSGPSVAPFSGLTFEILYKKVTPTIGLYHVQLTLPDAMRQLEFGEVSITLPTVTVDIYTNGNFKIDFGFPKGLDFSQSFSVQVFPFVGYGGFYFGLLTGETSDKVPTISNGRFDPVIIFGIGLSLGVGKTIDKGVLAAGLTITVIGILEGVLAWFKPDSDTVQSETYYNIQGTIAIVGRLFGKVDFKVISVDVEAIVYAAAMLTVQSHMPIYIHLEVGVSVRASIKILFVKITFKFSITLEMSFTIGSQTATPWQVVAGGSAGQAALAKQPTAHPTLRGKLALAARRGRSAQPAMDWTPVRVAHLVKGGKRLASRSQTEQLFAAASEGLPSFTVTLMPAFSQAIDPESGKLAVQAILLPMVPNGTEAEGGTADDSPFSDLVAHLVAWAIQARLSSVHSSSPVVTASDLALIYDQLNQSDIDQTGFSYENLCEFLSSNFQLILEVRDKDQADSVSGTIFPVLPGLTLTATTAEGLQSIDFYLKTPVSADYLQEIQAYLNQLRVDYENSVADDYDRKADGSSADQSLQAEAPADTTPSMATIIFQYYFLTLARAGIQAAIDLLEAYPYTIADPSPSLQELADQFSTSETLYTSVTGDTLQSIGDQFGVLVSVIQSVNPEVAHLGPNDPVPQGTSLVIPIGALTEIVTTKGDTLNTLSLRYQVPVATLQELNAAVQGLNPDAAIPPTTRLLLPVLVTPESIVLANLEAPLKPGTKAQLTGVSYSVRSGDTFGSIASNFSVDPIDLINANWSAAILTEGAAVAMTGLTYASHEGDTINRIATFYVGRLLGTAFYAIAGDTAATVDDILAQNPGVTSGANDPIQPGTTLNFTLPDKTAVTYVTNPLDTPRLVASYFISLQNNALTLSSFIADFVTLNNLTSTGRSDPLPQATYQIPSITYAVNAGDTLDRISTLFSFPASGLAGIANLPAVHASVSVPTFTHIVADGETLQSLSDTYNLSMEDLTNSIADTADLFRSKSSDEKQLTLTIPRVPARHTQDLVDDLLANHAFDDTAGMVSRFLLHGLQLPAPAPASGTMPLYALLGQQYSMPGQVALGYALALAPNSHPDEPELPFTFSLSSYYAAKGTTVADLIATLDPLNPDLFTQQITAKYTFPLAADQWLEIPALAMNKAAISLSESEISQIGGLQTATFNPEVELLHPLALYQQTPAQYSLQTQFPWQAAALPVSTCFTADGQRVQAPSIWPFPDSLQDEVDQLPDATNLAEVYELMTATQEDGSTPATMDQATCYTWATLVDFGIQRIPTSSGYMAESYLLVGADQTGRQRLQALQAYLEANSTVTTDLYLLYTPSGESGVRSDAIDPSATYLLRTNLSTLSQSGPSVQGMALTAEEALPVIPATGEYDALLTDVPNFVKLLWEASVVYSGGYYLHYPGGLPDDAFGQGNSTTLYLLALTTDPAVTSKVPPVGRLHNCAVLGQNIDTSKTSLFVQPIVYDAASGDSLTTAALAINQQYGLAFTAQSLALANQEVRGLLQVGASLNVGAAQPYQIAYGDTLASIAAAYKIGVADLVALGTNATSAILTAGAPMQIKPDQLRPVATVPPGNAGFTLVRPNPDTDEQPTATEDPNEYLQTLFQLLAFQIIAGGHYTKSPEGLPAGPTKNPGEEDESENEADDASGDTRWWYEKALAAYRFADDGLGSDVSSIDPDTGLPSPVGNPYRGVTGTDPLSLSLGLTFRDVYGNTTPPTQPVGPLTMATGYYDDLIGLNAWPSLSTSYLIQPGTSDPSKVYAHFGFAFNLDSYVAGSGVSYLSGIKNAGAHRSTYSQILYQIWQPDLLFRLRTSLDQPPNAPPPANDGYASDPASPPRTPYDLTLEQKLRLAALAGSTYAFLTAARNLDALTYKIQGGEQLQQVASDYATDVVSLLTANGDLDIQNYLGPSASVVLPTFYTVQVGDTVNGIAGAVSLEDLVTYNLGVVLNTGIDIATPNRSEPYTLKAGDTLRSIASTLTAEATALAVTNQTHSLTQGLALTVSGATLTTNPGDTLASMVDRFLKEKQVETTVADLAEANQNTPNLFDAAQQPTLAVADYVLQENDTLATVQAKFGFAPADVLQANGDLINLFAGGVRLQNGVTTHAYQYGDTINSLSQQYQVTLEQLAALNASQPLVASQDGILTIPAAVVVNTTTLPGSVYRLQGGESLESVAARYIDPATGKALTPAALAEQNRFTPYLFATGIPFQVKDQGGQSYSLTTQAGDTFASLFARLVAQGYPADQFVTFATSFAAVTGVLQAQALLACPPIQTGTSQTLAQVAQTYGQDALTLASANRSLAGILRATSLTYGGATIDIGPTDTLLSLIARFAAKGVAVTLADIVSQDAFKAILADSAWLLTAPILPTDLDVAITTTPVNPDVIFAVTVELEMARRLVLVHPDFAENQAVYLSQSTIAPQTSGSESDSTMGLGTYATLFEESFQHLIKAAVGTESEAGGTQTLRQVYAVDFRPGALAFQINGGQSSGLNPSVTYFALEPLSTALVSQSDVTIAPYVQGSGLDPANAQKLTFKSVDMDNWASQFLEAVDLFLSPEYAVGAFGLPKGSGTDDLDGASYYRLIVQQKSELVESIILGLTQIFDGDTGDLSTAQEALRQRLLISLSNAYQVDTVVQLPVTTSGPDTDSDTAPRLSGLPVLVTADGSTASVNAPYSLSTSKVPMVGGNGGQSATAYLNFLVNTQQKEAQADLNLDLRYAITEIEYGIGAETAEGYQASSWLTLILPIGGAPPQSTAGSLTAETETDPLAADAQIGSLSIPIPLRAYPSPPVLVAQTGGASTPPTTASGLQEEIKQLKSWDYSFTYDYAPASQDTVRVKMVFNPNGSLSTTTDPADYNQNLFAALAQFISVYPAVKLDLAGLTTGAQDQKTLAAVKAFAELVVMVNEGWKPPALKDEFMAGPPRIVYEFEVQADQESRKLTLNAISADVRWPAITALVPDGQTQGYQPDQPISVTIAPNGRSAVYDFSNLTSLPSRWSFTLEKLDVIAYQSGASSVRVLRNANLGQSQQKTVADAFQYQTPAVAFANAFVPLLIHTEAVSIRDPQESGNDPTEALTNLFTYLLFDVDGWTPTGTINTKVAWSYGYQLVAVDAGTAQYPISLAPRFDFQLTEAWRTGFPQALAQSLNTWLSQNSPDQNQGAYYLEVSVYAGENGQVDQPILDLRSLYYPLCGSSST